jgi:DNA-binding transcriptional LysR family regulator
MRSSTNLITCDITPRRSKTCFIPFFDLDVELFMRGYIVEHGQLDLVLSNDEGLLPSHFQFERLYKEDWICAVARESHFGDRLPLKQYLAASHIVVSPYQGVQTIPDKQLAAVGAKRSSCIRVPYFGVAMQCLPGTELVLTLTSGMTQVIKNDRRLRLLKAPQELRPFHFLMAWHPRANTDPRHVWLREAMRSTVAPNGNRGDR